MLNCTIYTREGCHLCEQMAADLDQALQERQLVANLNWVDIEGDLALVSEHGLRVPVLVIDQQEICFGRLDVEALDSFLE